MKVDPVAHGEVRHGGERAAVRGESLCSDETGEAHSALNQLSVNRDAILWLSKAQTTAAVCEACKTYSVNGKAPTGCRNRLRFEVSFRWPTLRSCIQVWFFHKLSFSFCVTNHFLIHQECC